MRPQSARAASSAARVGAVVGDDLDELHLGDRVEEVDADEALGAGEGFAQALERDARGVGGEDGAGLHAGLDLGVDLGLGLGLLGDRLDDDVGGARALAVEVGGEAVAGVAAGAAFVDLVVEEGVRAADRLGDGGGVEVGEGDGEAPAGAPGGDVAAHRARADDVDAGDGGVGFRERLQSLAQEEDADEVLRGGAGHQAGEAVDLGGLHGLRRRPRASPRGR
jgi:hypothetical protein